ncbi:MAG: hypothetical protein ACRDJM_00975 [Actinomycetota bacterium]
MSRNQDSRAGSSIPRWITGLNVAALVATLALVVPAQVRANHLSPPANLCVCFRPSQTAPKLTWSDTSGGVIQGYILRRSTTPDFTSGVTELRIARNTFDFIDETRAFNTTYWYQIQSYVGTDRSGPSNTARAVNGPGTAPPAPAAPDDLRITQQGSGLKITWRNNANNETGVWVERSGDEQATWEFRASLSLNSTSYVDNDPPPGGPFYRIWTFNSGGLSPSYAAQFINAQVPGVPSVGIPSIPNLASATSLVTAVPTNLASATAIASQATNLASATALASFATGLASNATNLASATSIASATGIVTAVPSPAAIVSTLGEIQNRLRVWIGIRQASDDFYVFTWQLFPFCFPAVGGTANCPEPPGATWQLVPGTTVYEYTIYTDTDPNS